LLRPHQFIRQILIVGGNGASAGADRLAGNVEILADMPGNGG
jgi:hypothetical protein